jgi:hypothetical protein
VSESEDGQTARTTDPDGREVVFDAGTRLHLLEGHRGWLLEHIDLILATVSLPDRREDDPRPAASATTVRTRSTQVAG